MRLKPEVVVRHRFCLALSQVVFALIAELENPNYQIKIVLMLIGKMSNVDFSFRLFGTVG